MEQRMINCTNKALVAYFLKHGVKPVDIFLGENETIVFRYDRTVTSELFSVWLQTKPER